MTISDEKITYRMQVENFELAEEKDLRLCIPDWRMVSEGRMKLGTIFQFEKEFSSTDEFKIFSEQFPYSFTEIIKNKEFIRNAKKESKKAAKPPKKKLIDLNKASLKDLSSIVSSTKAEAIIKYRLEISPFMKKEDIQNIKGIGKKTFDALADKITV